MNEKTISALKYLMNVQRSRVSVPKISKLLYLCDWNHSLKYGKKITDIPWELRMTGIEPEVPLEELVQSAKADKSKTSKNLSDEERNTIQSIGISLKNANIIDLRNLSDATYPATHGLEIGSTIDFAEMVKKYEKLQIIKQEKYRQEAAYADEQLDRIQ